MSRDPVTHYGVRYKRWGEDLTRSLCGRSSGRVWNTDTIESGQNVGGEPDVTCKFCQRLIAAGRHKAVKQSKADAIMASCDALEQRIADAESLKAHDLEERLKNNFELHKKAASAGQRKEAREYFKIVSDLRNQIEKLTGKKYSLD